MTEIVNKDVDVVSTDAADADKKAAGMAVAARFDAVVAGDTALQEQLRTMARADADDKKIKADEVPSPMEPAEEEVVGDEDEGEGDNPIVSAIKDLTSVVSGLVDRVAKIERGDEDEDDGLEEKAVAHDSARQRRQRILRRNALERQDSARYHDFGQIMRPASADYFANAQARADACASAFGASAPRPLSGEALRDYRVRLLRPYQPYSKSFKDIDVRAVDDATLFEKIEQTIFDEARQDANNPQMIPVGMLREIKGKTDAGHTMNTFVGRPSAWMHRFMPGGKAVVKINVRPPHAPAVW